jgi:hypothetical protein
MSVIHRADGKGVLCGQKNAKEITHNAADITCRKCLWIRGERDTRGQGIEITSEATGEVQDQKPYRSEEHLGFGKELVAQQRYIRQKLRDPEDPNAFAKLSPDEIMVVLDHLSGYYDRLGAWLVNQKLWLSDLKTQRQLAYNQKYLEFKRKKGETNETARAEASVAVHALDVGIDKCRHQFDTVEAWKKSIGRYHDAARSGLSWEKQSAYMQRRNDNTPDRRY